MKTIKKLILFLVIICLFVFTCSTLLIKRIYNNVLFHNTYDAAEGSIRQMEFNIKEKIDVIVKNITELMSAEAFKELNYANNLSSVYAYKEVNGFNKEVLNILNFSDDLASILYLDPDGYLVGTDGVTVWRELAGRDLSSKVDEVTSNEQRKLKNSSFFVGDLNSELFYEQKDYLHKENELYITIFVPCQVSSSTQRSGFLIVNVHEKIFRNIFSATMEKSGGEVYILNDRGKILSSTRTDLIQTEYLLKDNIRKDEKEHYFAVDGTYAISYEISWIHWNIIWERPIEDFYSEADYLYRILIAFILISLILVLFCYGLYMKVLLKPLNKLIGAMQDVGKGQYGIILNEKCEGEIGHVIRSFNEMSQDIANLTKENARVNNEKRTLQLLALQEQMSPHFVLNALNTIKWMATLAKEKNIVNMVIALSKVIYNFKNTSPFGTIGEEIDFVKNYIIVMNYRYGDVITVNYDVEDKLLNVSIPIFFIQPLVENSLKHGFESTNCQGHIRIRVWEENEKIFIRVTDNGSGLTKEKQDELKNKFERATQTPFNETGGVGLMNIAKRIQLYYGEEYGICIENTKEKGAQFLITLPYRREP